ncbi:MAG: type III polyketide synthase [Chromatiales bacterium]
MFVNGLGIATPSRRYTQAECWQALAATPVHASLSPRSQAILRKVLNGDNGIRTRHLALETLAQVDDMTPDAMHRRFQRHAPALAARAARNALNDAAVAVSEIDAVIVSTCTGYLCPGLSSYAIEHLGLRTDVCALDLVGHGCSAALPNMSTAAALLHSRQCERVLSICVEICSAAFFLDNDPGVLISACLFGDGAAAVVLSSAPQPARRRIEWTGYGSQVDPARRELLRFEHRRGMLRNVLTPPVPQLAAEYAEIVLQGVLAERELDRRSVSTWLWHAGGRDVLRALAERLRLDDEATRWSREVLSEYGNVSSASVLFVLQHALQGGAPGGWWWMSSFGAGFASHGALLRVDA